MRSAFLFLFGFPALRRFGEGEGDQFFAGGGADVLVHAQHLNTGYLLDHGFHDRPRGFNEVGADLLQQIPSLLGRNRLDQLLLCGGEHALQADDQQIVDEMAVNGLGPRPMYSCWNCVMPSKTAASISPCVFMSGLGRDKIMRVGLHLFQASLI